MSGRARLTLCSAAATLMAATALLPLVDRSSWFLQAALLLLVQAGVGAAARRVPLARPLTVAAQALVTVLLLTLVFAREQALAGIVPGPEAVTRFADLFQAGGDDVSRYAIPAPLSDGIRLMLIGGVLVIGLLVDTLAVTFRNAAPAGLPLLALYSVAAGLSNGGSDWLWFLVAAAGYLMLLLAEGRERLSQWGRVFGGAPRGPGGPGAAEGPVAPVRTGRRIGLAALGVALVVPLLPLPAIQGGLLDGTAAGAGVGNGGGGTISAVNPLVSLRDSLNVDQDRTVLTVRTNSNDLSDMYLRIVSLDDFDGTTWRPSRKRIQEVPRDFPTPTGLRSDVKRTQITTQITAADWYAQDWLPMPYPPSGVRIDGNWRFEPEGMTLVGDHGQNTRGLTYQVNSLEVRPTAQQLAAAPVARSSILGNYTEVPAALPQLVWQEARRITRGAESDYAKAVALQDYFAVTGGFQYDTQVDVGTGPDAIARFLRDKQGFCVHYSFAMAAMARTLGIPARVAVGFAPGTPQGNGTVEVSLRDAHAWPELYFEGVGWTRFEPTPTRGSTPSYTLPDTSDTSLPAQPEISASASAAPSAAPSASATCSAVERKENGCASTPPLGQATGGGGGTPWYQVAWWSLLAVLVVSVPLLPMVWRLRRRSVRLASARHTGAGGPERAGPQGAVGDPLAPDEDPSVRAGEAAVAYVLAVWQELTDTAWDFGIVPDDALTPRRAAERIVRLGELEEPAARSVHRVAGAVEQVLFSPRPHAEPGLADEVRAVRSALRARAAFPVRLRALVAPRSAVRAMWDLMDRWTALKASWAARWTELAQRLPWAQRGQQQGG
ncbi:transglutaminase domain-containing protein [Streptomyces roseirectus]|uniref:Transglutaminase domain-containing protein n=1 Tax=Streptomyces roseirectus TaxID=2768066 RepID=A0A7H0IK91_9ACTN|nr:DUF3488 and transglutaminase-like domain-containing protein [Streptomyces roseirectus]QNP73207.1 transglutaminase domain-containing protein [Streptomyces roseirectus]